MNIVVLNAVVKNVTVIHVLTPNFIYTSLDAILAKQTADNI